MMSGIGFKNSSLWVLHQLMQYQFVEYVQSVQVYLSDRFKGLAVKVGICSGFKVVDMFVCASQTPARAPKG